MLRIAQDHCAEPLALHTEQRRPVAVELPVDEDLQAEAVPVEARAAVGVPDEQRDVMQMHGPPPASALRSRDRARTGTRSCGGATRSALRGWTRSGRRGRTGR